MSMLVQHMLIYALKHTLMYITSVNGRAVTPVAAAVLRSPAEVHCRRR